MTTNVVIGWVVIALSCVALVYVCLAPHRERIRLEAMTLPEREAYLATKQHRADALAAIIRDAEEGRVNPVMVCPHCQTKGSVRTKAIERKVGISGGKATAAVLTAGWSLFATGLSRKEPVTQSHCCNCNATWCF